MALGGRGRAALAAHGCGRTSRVCPTGSLLVTLGGTGAPTDQAAGAARTALALREAPLAGRTHRARHRREMLHRALPARRGARPGSVGARCAFPPPAGTPGELLPIRIDEVAGSPCSTSGFDVGEYARSSLLRGQRNDEVHPDAFSAARPRASDATPELAFLETLVAQSAEEPVARAAVVTEPAGIGQSRLRCELLRRVRCPRPLEHGLPGLDCARRSHACRLYLRARRRGRCVRPRASTPASRSRSGQRKLAARLAQHVAPEDVGQLREFLGELVGAGVRGRRAAMTLRAARLNATLMGDQIRRAWLDFVQAECAEEGR